METDEMSADIPLPHVYSSFNLDSSTCNNRISTSSVKGYSQKNYHISDGTLYSVLIPHQNKPVTRTFRGSTPGRGRGRGRGSRALSTAHSRRQLKFHHQALPVEYLQHYAQQLQKQPEGRQQSSRESASALETGGPAKPETLNRVASVIAANCRRELPSTGVGRLQKRGRPRGRGRGSRAIPGFIQEVQGSMNNTQGRILVEKSLYETGDLTPSSVSTSVLPTVCKSLNTLLPSLLRMTGHAEVPNTPFTLPCLLNQLADHCSTSTVLPEVWSHEETIFPSAPTAEPPSISQIAAALLPATELQKKHLLSSDSSRVPSAEPLNLCIRDETKRYLVRANSSALQKSRRKCSTPRHLPPTEQSAVKPTSSTNREHHSSIA